MTTNTMGDAWVTFKGVHDIIVIRKSEINRLQGTETGLYIHLNGVTKTEDDKNIYMEHDHIYIPGNAFKIISNIKVESSPLYGALNNENTD